jgi:hypothetical protein
MARKKKKDEVTVSAKWNGEEEILLKIKDPEGNEEEITATVRHNSSLRFSYKYPGIKKKMSYQGHVEGDKLYLYPIIGVGVLSEKPLSIK